MSDTKPEPISDDDIAADFIEVPEWVDQEITIGQIKDIVRGGCDSGAYMPAVTYHLAMETMGRFGDEVLEYIEDYIDMHTLKGESWSGIAVKFLSCAVETWAHNVDIRDIERTREQEIEDWELDHESEQPNDT
jgi:hypothetical protein